MSDHVGDRSGQQIGHYRLLRLLGRGGFAEVYLGEHIYLKRLAALKILQATLTDQDRAGFMAEAQTFAKLNHPHIVRMFDYVVEGDTPFLVMEYAPHGSLRQRHALGTQLLPENVLTYVQQVSSALQYAHDQHLMHRDIKPENLLLGSNEEVLLSDFGLALLIPHTYSLSTQPMKQPLMGNIAYQAPEQLQGKPCAESDQYALGVVIYEWLCGQHPFRGSWTEIVTQHLSSDPPFLREQVPGISPLVEAVVFKALSKEPQQRFARIQDFATALEEACHSSPLFSSSSFTSLSSGLEHSSRSQRLKHPLLPAPIWKVPVSFTPLIGREQEVLSVCAFLKRPDVRLVTLLGTGGVGKTRLSIQVATELREHFVDGVCFVPLAAITDDTLVGAAIAKELDIRELGDMPILEHVQIALRKKHLLLVLDNFEQVVEASLAVEKLMAACPRLKVLVTSRTALHLQAEQEFPLAPLQLPDLRHLPTHEILAQNAAVALFVQRACAILPAFQLLPTNAPIVAEICVRLDGLPLAIELAAARIKLLSPPALLARLTQRLQVLTDGARAIDVRHRTLRTTLHWSYDLLDSEEQGLFRQLSVFAGGCTLEAVEAVRSPGDRTGGHHLPILDGVSSLLDKSLLRVSQEEEEPRILMLETVREYALERLQEYGEAEDSQRNHALYYLAFVEKASFYLKGDQQIIWLARVEWEQENLRAALTWLLAHQEAELALRFCAALWWFWYLRGHWSEGRHWQVETLKVAQACEPTPVRARVLYGAGYLAYRQNDYATARSVLEESVLLCRTQDIERDLANSLFMLGVLKQEQGEQVAARHLLDESLALCRTPGYTWELAYMLRKLAHLASRRGNLTQAADYAQEALPLAREVGDQFLIATTLCTLGEIAEQQGDLLLASARIEEGFRLASGVGNKALTAVALQNLGYIASLQGDLMLATARTEEGLLLAREQGDRTSITLILCTLGEIAWRQGELMRAKTWYLESMSLAQEIGDEALVGWNLVGLAEVAAVEAQPNYAARLFGAAETKLDVNVNMDARERADYERMVKSVRTQLGEKAFATTWAEGRSMTPEQLLAAQELAIRTEPVSAIIQPTGSTRGRPRYPAGLTAREVEVLQLVAQGLTDAQVADRLVITPRTVNFHLTSIYGKIGVSSRAAATRYAMEQELA